MTVVCSLLFASASALARPSDPNPENFALERRALAVADLSAPTLAGQPANRAVALEKCKDAKPDGMCGRVTVPLDRSDPSLGTVDLFFEFFAHRDPGPATSAILITEGGPGFSVTQDSFIGPFYRDLFDPLMDTRDLILLDQRGVGRSDAVDCPNLQHARGPIRAALRECGEQLGAAANLYASDNVALDIEAVRAALEIDKLDFYGGSNAAQDIQAYAARFPQHLRSAVLDSPVTSIGTDPFDSLSSKAWLRAAKLICKRSEACSSEPHKARETIVWLARLLRENPLEGVGHDAAGRKRRVRVTEGFLLWTLLGNDSGAYLAPSEVVGAAEALRGHGDERPLLRLAAEAAGPFFGDEGKPTQFSAGESFARYCTDVPMPWDKAGSRDERLAQYESRRAALPSSFVAPFSVDAWLVPLPIGPLGPDPCLDWPAPDPNVPTPVPPGAKLPGDVPALILAGDVDLATPVAFARLINQAWPNSHLVQLENGAHHTAVPISGRFDCAGKIILNFIADLDPGNTGCRSDVPTLWPAVGRFPKTAGQARQAQSAQGDESTLRDRRVSTVAAATVTDAIRRTFTEGNQGFGVGLRGGTFEASFSDTGAEFELQRARFARNVSVTGEVLYGFEDEVIDADVKVRASHGESGTLHITGIWFPFFPDHVATSLEIDGRLDGHRVNVRVPAT